MLEQEHEYMYSFPEYFRDSPLTILLFLVMVIIAIPVTQASTLEKEGISNYTISDIRIIPGEMSISPAMNITPTITVMNNGAEPGVENKVTFSATLGPVHLVGDTGAWDAPGPHEEKDYSVSFFVPFMQPGEYPLTITVTGYPVREMISPQHQMKAHKPVVVTCPRPVSSSRDCGCS